MTEMQLQEKINRINDSTIDLKKDFESETEHLREILTNIIRKQNEIASKQEESCTGVECVKSNLSELNDKINGKYDEITGKYDELKQKIGAIEEIVKKSAKKTAICSGKDGCNAEIPVGASYCPNCGIEISGWKGLSNWVPYKDRKK
jgi:predicted nuclease with TOPRIM domain